MKFEKENITNHFNSKTILDCVVRFAPERFVFYESSPSIDWMSNRMKKAITKRDVLFQQWISDPKQKNRESYRGHCIVVTSLISITEISCNCKKLGINPTTKTVYRTLKTHLAKTQDNVPLEDTKTLKK